MPRSFAIGITIHNEQGNIGRLLDALRGEDLEAAGLRQVYVVSSGSTDRSDAIVAECAARWPALSLVTEPERRGKASAINCFLDAAGESPEVLVLMSGDVLPEPGAVLRLVGAFDAPEVGMAGGRPSPTGCRGLIGQVVSLQWELHHQIALEDPKLGEAVAFRNLVRRVPVDTAVDEAAIEAQMRDCGLRLAYVPDAVIHNKGPETIADFLKQRRRIAAGHRHLKTTAGYQVSTTGSGRILRLMARAVRRNPRLAPGALAAAGLEVIGRLLGLYDLYVLRKNPYIWEVATTTKDLAGEPGRARARGGEVP
jgi:glycosyltransferase involved in cell wall biosynthesis